jgi:hypothetical protein
MSFDTTPRQGIHADLIEKLYQNQNGEDYGSFSDTSCFKLKMSFDTTPRQGS